MKITLQEILLTGDVERGKFAERTTAAFADEKKEPSRLGWRDLSLQHEGDRGSQSLLSLSSHITVPHSLFRISPRISIHFNVAF